MPTEPDRVLVFSTCRCRRRWADEIRARISESGYDVRVVPGVGPGWKMSQDGSVLLERTHVGPATDVARLIVDFLTG